MDLPIGRTFDCRFGDFAPRLRFLTAESLQLDIPTGQGITRQVVSTEAACVADSIFMLSWIEGDGTMVVHVQDFGTRSVFSHARLPDGTLVRSRGVIEWVDG